MTIFLVYCINSDYSNMWEKTSSYEYARATQDRIEETYDSRCTITEEEYVDPQP